MLKTVEYSTYGYENRERIGVSGKTWTRAKAESLKDSNQPIFEENSPVALKQGSLSSLPNQRRGSSAFVQVPLELLDYEISSSAFKLYAVLISYARRFGACWPSHKTLAEVMRLKPRRVIELVKELELAGLIRVESRAGEGTSNIYRLHKLAGGYSNSSSNSNADPPSKRIGPSVVENKPGLSEIAGGGMHFSAHELHESKIHEKETHKLKHKIKQIHPEKLLSQTPGGTAAEIKPGNVCDPKYSRDICLKTKPNSSDPSNSNQFCDPISQDKTISEDKAVSIRGGKSAGNCPPVRNQKIEINPGQLKLKAPLTLAANQIWGLKGKELVCDKGNNRNRINSGKDPEPPRQGLEEHPPILSLEASRGEGEGEVEVEVVEEMGKVKTILTRFGVSEWRASKLAAKLTEANLGVEYAIGWAKWIERQAAFRPINNPAGFLVQMVDQFTPQPISNVSELRLTAPGESEDRNDREPKASLIIRNLTKLIAIEERNLAEARNEREQQEAQAKLDKFLVLKARQEAVCPEKEVGKE